MREGVGTNCANEPISTVGSNNKPGMGEYQQSVPSTARSAGPQNGRLDPFPGGLNPVPDLLLEPTVLMGPLAQLVPTSTIYVPKHIWLQTSCSCRDDAGRKNMKFLPGKKMNHILCIPHPRN